jgi:hypothetical protein
LHPRLRLPALVAALLALAAGCSSGPSGGDKTETPEVKLQVVKLKEFEKALEAHRGKVVLVDIWADT